MPNPAPAAYSAAIPDRVYGGRSAPVRDPSDASLAWPPAVTCSIPDAEGVNAPIHPKVLDFGADPFGGYRYWMAYTPYPGAQDVLENPCVVASSDGVTWVAPASNPIEPAPPGVKNGYKYNSDTHLLFAGDTLHLIWRLFDNVSGPWIESLLFRSTTDGVTWSAAQPLNIETHTGVSKLLSPSVERHGGRYYCWTLNRSSTPIYLQLRTASALNGPWSAPQLCTLLLPDLTREPWHADVIRVPNGWLMLISDRSRSGVVGRLWLAYSKDGISWTPASTALSTAAPTMYRSSLVRTPDGVKCWVTDWDARKIKTIVIGMDL